MSHVAETIKQIIEPVASDLIEVEKTVLSDLQSDIPLIKKISDYIVSAGGKRMRPLILILIARALGYQGGSRWRLYVLPGFSADGTNQKHQNMRNCLRCG